MFKIDTFNGLFLIIKILIFGVCSSFIICSSFFKLWFVLEISSFLYMSSPIVSIGQLKNSIDFHILQIFSDSSYNSSPSFSSLYFHWVISYLSLCKQSLRWLVATNFEGKTYYKNLNLFKLDLTKNFHREKISWPPNVVCISVMHSVVSNSLLFLQHPPRASFSDVSVRGSYLCAVCTACSILMRSTQSVSWTRFSTEPIPHAPLSVLFRVCWVLC